MEKKIERNLTIKLLLPYLFFGFFSFTFAKGPEDFQRTEFNILEKIKEAQNLLEKEKAPLKVNNKKSKFYNTIWGVKRISSNFDLTEKEIRLVLLNVRTGELKKISVFQKIASREKFLVNPNSEFVIGIEERLSGLTWNSYNTPFIIKKPEGWIVIAVKYPYFKGRFFKSKPLIEERIYTPPVSEFRKFPEIAQAGWNYLENLENAAFEKLRKLGIKSKVSPKKTVAQLLEEKFGRMVLRKIILNEHIDPDEIITAQNKKDLILRVLEEVGANLNKARSWSISKAGAVGIFQIMDKSYKNIRDLYPSSKLIKNDLIGRRDHLNSAVFALLLIDYHLSILEKRFSSFLLENPNLEEIVFASYNAGPKRVEDTFSASINQGLSWDWSSVKTPSGIRLETKKFIWKLRLINSFLDTGFKFAKPSFY